MSRRPIVVREIALAICAMALLGQTGCKDRSAAADQAAGGRMVFNESIEPILSENCYACHGPDPGARKAGLRLDRGEFAFAPHAKSGPAIIAGDPDRSPLVRRIESRNPKQVMPPPDAHKTLKREQIALLRRWVKEGAEYQEHWAFITPQRPPPPAIRHGEWARSDIDRFILARLEREGLKPSPEADRSTLIRRVSYDLTGLPPTPEETEAYLRDPSANAYEKVVDRLLASPRYGEHRAHYWLDVVRFADTHGLHQDSYRSVWPYRDYVIKSYNENKPFDRFTREQLAGDLLPAENADQLVATAFLRLGVSSGEGGTILEELASDIRRERTEAFGAVYMGMTTGCAVCHDHKFDPITQKDFYRLSAYFGNMTELAYNFNTRDWPPFIKVPKPENRAAYDAVLAQKAGLERQIGARRRQASALVAAWLSDPANRPKPVATTGLTVRLRLDEQSGTSLVNSAPGAAFARVAATGSAPIWGEENWLWPSFRMTTSTRVEMPQAGDVEKDQAFSAGAWIMPHFEEETSQTAPFGTILGRVDSTQGSRGWELYFDTGKPSYRIIYYNGTPNAGKTPGSAAGRVSLRLIHQWPDDAIVVETVEPVLLRQRWNHVFATYDGSGKAAGVRIYTDGKAQAVTIVKDALSGSIRSAAPLQLAREYPDAKVLSQPRIQDFRFYARALSAEEAPRVAYEDFVAEIVRRPMAKWTEDEWHAVSDFFFAHDGPTLALAGKVAALDKEAIRLAEGGDICLVADESPNLAYAHVLTRGVYSAPAERVRPGAPHFLPAPPPGAPANRLGLADWVLSPANPLTARVVVNRMWQELFGTGIVETTEDFGLVGERPSHPQLLDWLAVDFRENGWDVKRFYKQVVMSATYRQTARATPALLERDPHNRLLARGPRFRMDAEMIRDTALAVSGLLVEKIGGPSVKPYQPPGVWEAGGAVGGNTSTYKMDHGGDLYRRSLYTFWKRMGTMPNMDAFDLPGRDASCTRRQRSNTPLQALVVMNDPQWLEAARALAERVVLNSGTTEGRLDFLGRLLLARAWEPREKSVLEAAYDRFRAMYAGRAELASELVAVGESHPKAARSATELAPWMLVASTALNLNETLNK